MASSSALAAEPGTIDHIEFTGTPLVQGLGGPVTVKATIFVATDPHRNVFVNNLRAQLSLSPGLQVTQGDNPYVNDSIEISPTVTAYLFSIEWLLTTLEAGDQTVSLTVTTAAAGAASASLTVRVREGVVLGRTTLSPARPTTGDALVFSTPVASGFDELGLRVNVTLFVFESLSDVTPLSANGSRLRLTSGEVVSGVRLPMAGANGTYAYTIPPQPRGALVYWVFVETPFNNVTSSPARVFIEDPSVTVSVVWGLGAAILAVFAVAAGFVILDPWSKRTPKGALHNTPERIRPSILLLLLGIALFAYSLYSGAVAGVWGLFK